MLPVAKTMVTEIFGSSLPMPSLIEAKTVTIAKRMAIAPDPTSSLYNTTMYRMAGLLGIALLSKALIRPVHSRHYIQE